MKRRESGRKKMWGEKYEKGTFALLMLGEYIRI